MFPISCFSQIVLWLGDYISAYSVFRCGVNKEMNE